MSEFIPGTNYQLVWRSSELGTLKDCPRKYQYSVVEGWTSRSGVHLNFGEWYHAARELFDNRKVAGDSFEDALYAVVAYLLRVTWIDGKPWESGHSKKTRETLIRSVIWALDQYRDDPMTTLQLASGPAVELEFNMEIEKYAPNGQKYVLQGHLDRIVKFGDETYILDYKTTGSTLGAHFFAEFNPHNQMSLYTLASRVVFGMPVAGVIIDAAQIAVGFTSFGRGITTRSAGQLEEYLRDTEMWLDLAERFAAAEHWPLNEASCNKYGGCPFRTVCSQDPKVREDFLKTQFERKISPQKLEEKLLEMAHDAT